MFRFFKNHLQGACFALLKLLVLISFHYFEWYGSMPVKLQKIRFNPDYIQNILYRHNHRNLSLISITYIRLRQKLFVVVCSLLLRLILCLSYTVGFPCHLCNWRGGWVHRPVILWSVSLSDVSVVYAWFPNSSSVILFCMLSGVVKFHYLDRIRICSVGYVCRKQIVGYWFWYSGCALCTWCLCLYRSVLHTSYYACSISSCKYHSGFAGSVGSWIVVFVLCW